MQLKSVNSQTIVQGRIKLRKYSSKMSLLIIRMMFSGCSPQWRCSPHLPASGSLKQRASQNTLTSSMSSMFVSLKLSVKIWMPIGRCVGCCFGCGRCVGCCADCGRCFGIGFGCGRCAGSGVGRGVRDRSVSSELSVGGLVARRLGRKVLSWCVDCVTECWPTVRTVSKSSCVAIEMRGLTSGSRDRERARRRTRGCIADNVASGQTCGWGCVADLITS